MEYPKAKEKFYQEKVLSLKQVYDVSKPNTSCIKTEHFALELKIKSLTFSWLKSGTVILIKFIISR